MIKTMYGFIPDELLGKFQKVSGNILEEGEWHIEKDELEYWQLTNPSSTVPEKKWQKRLGYLPVRDFNFQYACYKNPKWVDVAGGTEEKKEKIKVFDVEKAIKYAEEKLFVAGKPVYLPEVLEERSNPMYNGDTKPTKGYNKILEEQAEIFNPEA